MNLQLQTKELGVYIENYTPYKVQIDEDFVLYDTYTPIIQGKNKRGNYKLIYEYVNTKTISEERLFDIALKMNMYTKTINLLFKYVTGYAIGTDSMEIDSYTKQVLTPNDCTLGWETNYDDVLNSLSQPPLKGKLSVSVSTYVILDKNPLFELEKAIKNYSKLDQKEIDLMKLNSAFDYSYDIIRYMALGKALEIVNSMYPLGKKRNDTRIHDNWPEMDILFGDVTIKDLIKISNTRKETRHYILNGGAHPAMTENERKKYYELTNLLITNIIRQRLGLELVDIIQEPTEQ